MEQKGKQYKELIRLHYGASPGDTLVGTLAVEALHRQHPGKYLTCVSGTCVDAIFANSPFIHPQDKSARKIEMHYPLINQSNQRPIQFVDAYVQYLADQLGIKLYCPSTHPALYLTDREKQPLGREPFWIINAGFKSDYPVKHWHGYQELVDATPWINWIQVGENSPTHTHKPLIGKNVTNLIGRTTARELIVMGYHAQGAVCGITFLHHIMAAHKKPCVTISPGWNSDWERYGTERMLRKSQCLPCAPHGGCWKSRVIPQRPDDQSVCSLPVLVNKQYFPKCMELISVQDVVSAIQDYYAGGLIK